MPELPEVETTRRGVEPHLLNRRVTDVIVRQRQLRWPVSEEIPAAIAGKKIVAVERRGKYLIIRLSGNSRIKNNRLKNKNAENNTVLVHLGMSGSLRIVPVTEPPQKHDHVDIQLSSKQALRLTDPRRFGAVLWSDLPLDQHKLLKDLGPEPLTDEFTGELLFQRSRKRQQSIKTLIMDSKIVVGVGNIYANEALFLSGIRPRRRAGKITKAEALLLATQIKQVLAKAIAAGGTTLRDFTGGDGKPGYFKQELFAYGREGLPCLQCGAVLKEIRLAQRSTVYCPACQR